ncbi:MAG TPA: hypothetical protein VGW12_16470 [Pyrinomonadaceae bacterium]|nr:hypothetical protein [Pyrinomonadaceae bacterium]
MNVEAITKALYGFLGVVLIVVGASVLLLETGLLPGAFSRAVSDSVNNDASALHIVQEFGAFLVFVGLITLWFMRHYAESRFFHWALTAAWALIALAHWFDVRGSRDEKIGPIINSVPFVLFLLLGLLRRTSKTTNVGRAI